MGGITHKATVLHAAVQTGRENTQASFRVSLQLVREKTAVENHPGVPHFTHQIGKDMKTPPSTTIP